MIRPARPGSRDENGGMAFRVWVRHVAPARRPDSPSSIVAVEWPIDTRTPWPAREEIRAAELGSSGAMVANLIVEDRLEEP